LRGFGKIESRRDYSKIVDDSEHPAVPQLSLFAGSSAVPNGLTEDITVTPAFRGATVCPIGENWMRPPTLSSKDVSLVRQLNTGGDACGAINRSKRLLAVVCKCSAGIGVLARLKNVRSTCPPEFFPVQTFSVQ